MLHIFPSLHSTFHPTVAKLKKFLEINSTSTDKEGKSWKSIDSNYNRLWFQFHWVSALRLNLLLRHKGSVSSFDWHFFPLDRALSSEFVSLSHVVSWVLLKFDGAWSSQFQTLTAFFFDLELQLWEWSLLFSRWLVARDWKWMYKVSKNTSINNKLNGKLM